MKLKAKEIHKKLKRLDKDDPWLIDIYKNIVEYDEESKVKPQKIKVNRYQITNFLLKRYGPNFSKKIIKNFNFENIMSFEEY